MENLELSNELQSSLEQHADRIKALISKKASELASEERTDEDQKTEVTVLHLARAIEMYAPGHEVVRGSSEQYKPESFYERLPPITLISAILAVTFGVIGVAAIQFGEAKGIDGKGFIDIAKIFAGAIVGSATAVAVTKRGKA